MRHKELKMKLNWPETEKSRYDTFKKLNELTSMKDFCVGERVEFHKMVQTGELEFFDYNTGFINFEIYLTKQDDGWFVRIWLATIDDGDMGTWKKCEDREEGEELIRKFAEEYLKNLRKFPKLADLNDEIMKYGFYIINE